MKIIKVRSYSKINIGLEVLYKRNDGYHEINTIFAPVCITDDLTIERSNNISIESNPVLDIRTEDNLIYKAALKLKDFTGYRGGANINIKKSIPMGGGLGGGSSNAGTTLLALNELWGTNVSKRDLCLLGQSLGSDVPFFLERGFAVGRGRGEILEYFDCELPWTIVVVNPGIHISTPEAYKALNRSSEYKEGSDLKAILLDSITNPALLKLLRNDFEEYVNLRYPEIASIIDGFYEEGVVLSMLSGSGSSVFGFFNSPESAFTACGKLLDYNVFVCNKES